MPPIRRGSNLQRRTTNAIRIRTNTVTTGSGVASDDMNQIQKFQTNLDKKSYCICINCRRSDYVDTTSDYVCNACRKDVNKFTAANNMCPTEVPMPLRGLTMVEQLFIARVHPVMRIYQVRASGSTGQFHYSGNIININQDIIPPATSLPLAPTQLGIVIVRRAGLDGYTDFRVRKRVVLNALQCLQAINPLYSDITINDQVLSSLPEDGNIANLLPFIEEGAVSDLPIECDVVDENAVTFAPRPGHTEAVQTTLNWPTASTEPINEFRQSGYIPQAFPHLFPDGKCDFLDFSRNTKLTFREWCEFLMRYHDQRFAQDPRFRFFCVNTMQRHDALRQSGVMAKTSDLQNINNIQQLAQKVNQTPSLIKKILSWGSKIRGTSAYWFQQRCELLSMVNQLGVPTLFLTLSAADLWWPCLIRLYGISDSQRDALSEKDLSRLMQKKLNENPLIADQYFTRRVNEFMKTLKSKLKIVDFWFRYEWQHRGSPHVHMILWIENAPDVRTFDSATFEQLQEYIQFYDLLVNATNPSEQQPPAQVHPSRIKPTEIDLNNPIQQAELLNRVNRHTKHSIYCLRMVNGREICRFNYPKPLANESTLEKNESGVWLFTPKRNDELLNDYNVFVSQTWRANTDCKVIASEHAIINYLSKYAAKGEPQSHNYQEIFQTILQACNPDDPSKKAISKLMIKLIGQRDISACEVMHLLTGEPLKQCSRTFAKIYIGIDDYTLLPIDSDDHDQIISTSMIDHYANRDASLGNLCLKEFCIDYHWTRGQLRKCRSKRILQILPNVSHGINEEQDEIYYKQKLILNKPWTSLDELKTNQTWKESFINSGIQLWEINGADIPTADNDDTDTPENEPFDGLALAAALPNRLPAEVTLGYRDIDRQFNWYANHSNYDNIEHALTFIKRAKETYELTNAPSIARNNLMNNEQAKVMQHLQNLLCGQSDQKLAIIQGAAGTGKSHLIHQMVQLIEHDFGAGSVLLMAPTGVAANNINGQTLHSALRLSTSRGQLSSLSGEAERNFQNEMETVKVCIIDEMSMLGIRVLVHVDQRLRQAFPNQQDEAFGGTIMLMLGDFNQLPPVLDRSLLAPIQTGNTMSTQGRLLFEQFTKVFVLNEIMRQTGETQRLFRDTLNRMASGHLEQTDYNLLMTRFSVNNLSSQTQFKSALRIFAKKAEVSNYNLEMLRSMDTPITVIQAKNNCDTALRSSDDDAHGLPNKLQLAVGCRVMLKNNTWTAQGLCNGSLGTVKDIVYVPQTTDTHLDDHPLCVLVQFDNYHGPTIYDNCVPILPVTVGFRKGNTSCTRKQFPLQVAYGITIHKSQGVTVDKAVVDIGDSEFALGLTYVALSRVKTLDGLLIDPAFPPDRLFKSINLNSSWLVKRQEMARLQTLAGINL